MQRAAISIVFYFSFSYRRQMHSRSIPPRRPHVRATWSNLSRHWMPCSQKIQNQSRDIRMSSRNIFLIDLQPAVYRRRRSVPPSKAAKFLMSCGSPGNPNSFMKQAARHAMNITSSNSEMLMPKLVLRSQKKPETSSALAQCG